MQKYTQEQIDRANETELVPFLMGLGERFKKSGKEFRWMTHDSVTVNGNQWFRFSNHTGGGPVDFLMEFYGKSFPEAVEMLLGESGENTPGTSGLGRGRQSDCLPPTCRKSPVCFLPILPTASLPLPERNGNCRRIREYLVERESYRKRLLTV